MLNKNVRAPEVEEFRTNLDEAKTPLGKAGVAAPSRKMGPKAPCLARTGWFVQATARIYSEVERTTPSAPSSGGFATFH